MGSDILFHTYKFLTIAGLVFCVGTYGTIGLRIFRWSATVGYVFTGQRAQLHYIDDFDSASFPLHSFLFFHSFTFVLPLANMYVLHSSLMVPEQVWNWHFCSYRCVFFVLYLFFVSPCLVLSVASWGSVNLAVSSSSWEWRFLYSHERYVLHSSLSTFSAWLLTLGMLNDPKLETLMNWELVKMYMICRICWRVSSREEWRRLKTYNQHTQTVFDQI
jgi:hypothetical protein